VVTESPQPENDLAARWAKIEKFAREDLKQFFRAERSAPLLPFDPKIETKTAYLWPSIKHTKWMVKELEKHRISFEKQHGITDLQKRYSTQLSAINQKMMYEASPELFLKKCLLTFSITPRNFGKKA